MKLEKREISLNEYYSLKDALQVEKSLLIEYACALESLVGKERKNTALEQMKEVGEDMLFVCDLLRSLDEN